MSSSLSKICSAVKAFAAAGAARGLASKAGARKPGPSKQRSKKKKENVGKFKVHITMPTPEKPSNNEKYSFNSPKGVEDLDYYKDNFAHIVKDTKNYEKCGKCGNYCKKGAVVICDLPNCPRKKKGGAYEEESESANDE